MITPGIMSEIDIDASDLIFLNFLLMTEFDSNLDNYI